MGEKSTQDVLDILSVLTAIQNTNSFDACDELVYELIPADFVTHKDKIELADAEHARYLLGAAIAMLYSVLEQRQALLANGCDVSDWVAEVAEGVISSVEG